MASTGFESDVRSFSTRIPNLNIARVLEFGYNALQKCICMLIHGEN